MTDHADEIVRLAEEMNYTDIRRAIGELEKVMRSKEKEAKKQAQEELKATAAKYGMSLEELTGGGGSRSGQGRGSGKVPPKYRHPDTGKTWTGRGRKPKWVQEWMDSGRDIEELRIQGA